MHHCSDKAFVGANVNQTCQSINGESPKITSVEKHKQNLALIQLEAENDE